MSPAVGDNRYGIEPLFRLTGWRGRTVISAAIGRTLKQDTLFIWIGHRAFHFNLPMPGDAKPFTGSGRWEW